MSKSRILSSLFIVGYVVTSFTTGGVWTALNSLGFCLLPWACIWFPEILGDYMGLLGRITKTSPAPMVWFMGWVVLLVPLLAVVLMWLESI